MNISKQLGLICVLGIFAWFPGCAAPPAEDPAGQKISGGVMLTPDAGKELGGARVDWLPVVGRMGDYARKRHLPAESGWKTLFKDEFDNVSGREVPGWRINGPLELKSVQFEGEQGIELQAPDNLEGECSLQRKCDPLLLARRDLHLRIRFSCRSQRRVEAFRGIDFSLLVADQANPPRLHERKLPLAVDITAGWETANWWLRLGSNVSAVTLLIRAQSPGAILTLEEISLSYRDPLSARASVTSTRPATQPSPMPINAIIDGDFESGQHSFCLSGSKRWPNGDELRIPQRWVFDGDAAVGDYSMKMQIAAENGRTIFGPLDLLRHPKIVSQEASRWYLSFYGRAERPTNVTATLRTRHQTIGRHNFRLTDEWQRFTRSFTVVAISFHELLELACAELVFDFAGAINEGIPEEEAQLNCWLDGVALTDQPIERRFVGSAPVQVGLLGSGPDSADLVNLLDEKEVVSFGVRLVPNEFRSQGWPSTRVDGNPGKNNRVPSIGKLAIDLLNAWDRVVWTKTTAPAITDRIAINDLIELRLPRGYYRILATLWSGEPGESEIVSCADLALAVISLTDRVPLSNMFGLSSDEGNVSLCTTQLGAGWLRIDLLAHRLQVAPLTWDFSLWETIVQQCQLGRIEMIVGLTLPHLKLARMLFLERWLTSDVISPLGVVISPPTISIQPTKEYIDQLLVLRKMLAETGQSAKLIRDLSASSSSQESIVDDSGVPIADVVGFACTATAFPEISDSLLEEIGRRHFEQGRLWDLRVPVRLGGRPVREYQWSPEANKDDVVQRLAEPADPVRSASRMVRGLLIRSLAGAEMVCCDAYALSPVRSIYEDHSRRLHEPDFSPRAALVAFDFMTSLLNEATLTRWLDEPISGSRILYHQRDDGGAVAAVWRPFGLSFTRLGFANLPPSIEVRDCMGLTEPKVIEADLRVIPANEIVRYIIALPGHREALRKSLDNIKLVPGPTTQPAH